MKRSALLTGTFKLLMCACTSNAVGTHTHTDTHTHTHMDTCARTHIYIASSGPIPHATSPSSSLKFCYLSSSQAHLFPSFCYNSVALFLPHLLLPLNSVIPPLLAPSLIHSILIFIFHSMHPLPHPPPLCLSSPTVSSHAHPLCSYLSGSHTLWALVLSFYFILISSLLLCFSLLLSPSLSFVLNLSPQWQPSDSLIHSLSFDPSFCFSTGPLF